FDSYIDTTQRYAKITILLKTGSNHRIKEILESLKTYMAGQLGDKAVVSFGGDVTQTIALTETMVHGKLMNILQISFAVFFISALVFRSISAGLIVLTPLLFSILAIFGVMGWLDIPLNIPNSLISAMAVGIGADYAIYFLYRLREILREEGGDIKDAIRKTLSTAGKASLFVATAVAGGYGVLSLSQGFHVHQWLAMFIVIAMLFSVFATLIMVPTMILILKPRFIFSSKKKSIPVAQTVVTSLLLGTVLTMSMPKTSHADEVQDIVNRSDDASKFLSSTASAKFILTSKNGEQRVRLTKNMTKLAGNTQNNMRLTEFISPADVQGTTTLLIENAKGSDSMFVYLPALKKVRRLASANKGDAFIGTDFSYGDVLGYKLSDWKYTKLADGKFNGKDCYMIEATPINNTVKSDFGYSKRRMCILKDNFVTATIDIWDTAGKPLKHIEFTDIRPYGKVKPRWQAMKSMAKNLQTQHMTQVIVNDFAAEKTLSDKLFSPQSLEK
ncbi:TPA: outer membrane lipoprotein-sorting protein, partial [Acinetobacter baumannii]|nr:outer membrane lipoprotein-sorting protein [Acinetobacter baumannii]